MAKNNFFQNPLCNFVDSPHIFQENHIWGPMDHPVPRKSDNGLKLGYQIWGFSHTNSRNRARSGQL